MRSKSLLAIMAMVVMLLISSPALAVEIVQTNQSSVGWLAVTTHEDNTLIDPSTTVSYRVYKKNVITGIVNAVGDTTELEYTITFGEIGFYWAGVSAFIRINDPVNIGEVFEKESQITWSNSTDPEACPVQFCIAHILGPHYVVGFVSK